MSTVEALKTELETYEEQKGALVAKAEGKFVLIHESQIAGIWDTYEDALQAGYQAFGLMPFLVKQVQAVERVQFISRGAPTCPS